MRVSIPGPGGSLGECVICGKTFLSEILLNKRVRTVRMEGFSVDLPLHDKCLTEVQALSAQAVDDPDSWQRLPDGPLRQEFARAVAEAKSTQGESSNGN